MWSNDDVADEYPDESPWTRDDWGSDSAVPDTAFAGSGRRPPGPANAGTGGLDEPAPEDFDDRGASVRSTRSSRGRSVVAGVVVSALLIGSAGALLRHDDDDAVAPATTSFADPAPNDTEAPRDSIPATTLQTVTVPPPDSSGDAVVEDHSPTYVVGEVPIWAERTLAIPDSLAAMAPTEVVTLSQSGVLNVTEFPNGRTRSLDVSGLGADTQFAVGDRTIVVFDSTTLVQLRDAEPAIESTLADGIIFVQSWTGTGNFVVTTPSTGLDTPESDWVLWPDGTLTPLVNPFVVETTFFARVFSPGGDALANAPGGVYAIDPEGSAERISTGTLIATGERHWAIEECDAALRCASSIVEWESGAVTAGVLDPLERFGFIDPSTHISPDGRSIAFRADTDGSGRREILDVATGSTLPAGRINQVVYADSWASDSSGLFFTDRFLQFVDRSTGTITTIDGLDRVRTVATAPFAPISTLG